MQFNSFKPAIWCPFGMLNRFVCVRGCTACSTATHRSNEYIEASGLWYRPCLFVVQGCSNTARVPYCVCIIKPGMKMPSVLQAVKRKYITLMAEYEWLIITQKERLQHQASARFAESQTNQYCICEVQLFPKMINNSNLTDNTVFISTPPFIAMLNLYLTQSKPLSID